MANHKLIRASAILLLIGELLFTYASEVLHPGGGNTLEELFANFAASTAWTAIHLAQFVAWGLILGGLLVLFLGLNVSDGMPRWMNFFGAVSTGVSLALSGVLYAVDGVANKQAVDAWVSASVAEKTVRFASAQALRWIEMGVSSYHELTFGLALLLFGIAIISRARVPRPIGYLMGLSGLGWLALGWFTGTKGFTSANNIPADIGFLCLLASTIWLLVITWPRKTLASVAPV